MAVVFGVLQSWSKGRHWAFPKPPQVDTPRPKAVLVFRGWDELGSSAG